MRAQPWLLSGVEMQEAKKVEKQGAPAPDIKPNSRFRAEYHNHLLRPISGQLLSIITYNSPPHDYWMSHRN
jgi:hypothetical protein